MSKVYKKYKQKKGYNSLFTTIKILLAALCFAILMMFIVFACTEGIQAVIDWFKGKWFTLVIVLVIFTATAILWLISFVKKIRSFGNDGQE